MSEPKKEPIKWETLRIPQKLLEDVTVIVAQSSQWINEPEFIREAIREKIRTIEEKYSKIKVK